MKDYRKSEYTVVVNKFQSYEINESGKWNPYYILDFEGLEGENWLLILKCFDITHNITVTRGVYSNKNICMDIHIRPIETDSKYKPLRQYYKWKMG